MKKRDLVFGLLCLLVCIALALPAAAQYQNNPPASNQYPAPPAQNNPQSTYPPPPPQNYPVQSDNVTRDSVPAGTQLSIRTNDPINATKDDVGRTYAAEIADNIMGQSGQVLIPKGSPALLTVTNAGAGRMGVGNTQVELALKSVTINGQTYNVDTNTVKQSGDRGIGANKRTATMTGGGALLGTLVGAMAGGGKGAAIGAVLGGVGGATAQVLTRGSEVKVPAETLLTFKLDQPLQLR